MERKEFTEDEMNILRANPYVKNITPFKIRFNVAFKERFWEEYQLGRPIAAIVADMGIDPEVLGSNRLYGIAQHVKDAAYSGEGFRDYYKNSRDYAKDASELPASKALTQLQHEVSYMKQELEFIKKIISLDKEGKRKCSSEAKQMPSSGSSKK